MTDEDHLWYYDTTTGSVSQGKESSSSSRMGPYPDKATAQQALTIAAERNKSADRADEDWNR
ncbi:hypothetical protein ABH922_002550 [Rhodococcus sp. 27YEA15]|uniref:hypothetical protein n=1 Tax=Rhodococcus sp. 27YEA15 TaxID=3156259 RepID=UPI003C7E010F